MKSAIWHDSKNVVIPVVRSPWLRIRRPVTRTGPSPHPDTLFEFRDCNGLFPPCRRDRFASPRTTDRSSIYRWHLTESPAIADLCCVEVESVQRRKLPPPPTDRGERLAGQTLDSRRPGCPPPPPCPFICHGNATADSSGASRKIPRGTRNLKSIDTREVEGFSFTFPVP